MERVWQTSSCLSLGKSRWGFHRALRVAVAWIYKPETRLFNTKKLSLFFHDNIVPFFSRRDFVNW